ncbi:hypothetical protein Agub_g8215 [Astrephomene gubernaculifera]|uniref:VDE lipocalin domain-containing protein n=1 Tax=Astrephomene gubernaculifera TaxID=47775 RepID=A0AAD3HN24_9CHLO|nr:hypothetical protein Agub_g8215 [Astrephomene gubernaculifera]
MLARGNLLGKPDGTTRRHEATAGYRQSTRRASRTLCATRNGGAEAHAQHIGSSDRLDIDLQMTHSKTHNISTRLPTPRGNTLLVSHEVLLTSDTSDYEENRSSPRFLGHPGDLAQSQGALSGDAAQQQQGLHRGKCPEQQQQQQQQQRQNGNTPASFRPPKPPSGPAAALTSSVVASVRRRTKLGGPVPPVHKTASQPRQLCCIPAAAAAAASAGHNAGGLDGIIDDATGVVQEQAATTERLLEGLLPRRLLGNRAPSSRMAFAVVLSVALVAAALAAAAAVITGTAPSSLAGPGIGTTGGGPISRRSWYGLPYKMPYMHAASWVAAAMRPLRRGGSGLRGAAASPIGSSGSTGTNTNTISSSAAASSRGHVIMGGSGLHKASGMRPLAAVAGDGGGGGGGGAADPSTGAAAAASAAFAAGGEELQQSSIRPPSDRDYEWRDSARVRVITIASGGPSPYRTDWGSLADHTAQRLERTDPAFQMLVFPSEQLGNDLGLQQAFLRALGAGAQMLVGLDVIEQAAGRLLRDPRVTSVMPSLALFVGGSEPLAHELTRLQRGLRPQDTGSWRTLLARKLPWTPDGRELELWDRLQLLLGRHDSDNFLFVYLVLINQYIAPVRQVADTTKGFDLQSLVCMIRHCGSKVVGCLQDATCKSALDCLNGCTFNDQVCQYRCIVSYESPLLEQFSLCILQLHNCRNLDAKPPLLPDPAPMSSFRGEPLSHTAAEELFIGWLDKPAQGAPAGGHLGERPGKAFSWLIAAGKNPAYDYFPCQHQMFYRGRGSGQMWYEPVFKAITLDGRQVWRRRVYRVRRGKAPGTFHLSVLDNGVTSNEFWRILDCDEEQLAYCLFYYSGAASKAGLSYSGAVLGTPDGRMPGPQHTERLHAALRRAGIEPWELSYVDNSGCEEAPLGITGPVGRAVVAAGAGS